MFISFSFLFIAIQSSSPCFFHYLNHTLSVLFMSEHIEQQIAVSGSLFSVSLFQEKLMKNFLLISNKLRKLEGVLELQQRTKAIEKEFKFLAMKVDTITQKLPKDNHPLTKSDVKVIAKDIIFQVLNANDEKLSKTKYHTDLLTEVAKLKSQIGSSIVSGPGGQGGKGGHERREGSKASFTAGQALRQSEKIKLPKEALQECLNQKELELVSEIVQEKQKEKEKTVEKNLLEQLSNKYEQLTKIVQQLRMGRGYASFLQREAQKFQRFQQFQQKSRQTARKIKEKPISLEGVKQQNVKGEIMKRQLLSEVQRMELNKQQIAKHELMQKKTLYSNSLFPQVKEANQLRDIKDTKDSKQFKESNIVTSIKDLKQKEKEGFKRSGSIKKLDRLDKRLRVDDMKDLNSVLREIQLRIESKVSHDIFMGFVRDFEEKLELVRLSRDTDSEINELRKNVFVLQSKVQSVVGYLQSLAQEDEALLVKKQWTCVSCDKGLEKYQGKVGQHLNWDNVNAKKMSPIKVGAFGQTGQLAAKIRNLMQGDAGQ